MQLRIQAFDLPLRHVFTISRESVSVQQTLIVELSRAGQTGYGEATTNRYYGATIENMTAALDRVRGFLSEAPLEDPAALWGELASQLADQPFALCALDLAIWDLFGKLRGQPVHKLWGLDPRTAPRSDYTIGIDTVEKMVAKLNEFPGWPIYKIKLGTPDDLKIVRELRKHTSATFRVDANCGWQAEETVRNSRELKPLGVEFIEQPLPNGAWEDQKIVFAQSALPIIADESCQREEDVARCAGHFHGINIKLVKCGGLTPARRMIDNARQLGMKTMVGCMTESSVGISAIAQLAPLLDYLDADGAVLLAKDIASGVRVERGVLRYPAENGNGVKLLS